MSELSAAAEPAILSSDVQSSAAPNPAVDPPSAASDETEAPPTALSATVEGLSETEEVDRRLWLRRGDQIIVWLLMVALLVLLTLHWLRLSRWGSVPVELSSRQPREYFYSLDVNSASWVEWAQLEGIGEKLARRIVADRDARGPFRDADDVDRVKGIGPKLLQKLKPFLRGGTDHDGPTGSEL